MTNLKDNIWIEGFDSEEELNYHSFGFSVLENDDNIIYKGKTSEIPEEVAKECVAKIHVELAPSPYNDWCGGFDYAYVDYKNIGEYAGWQGDAGCYRKATESIQSACDKPYCTIYKK